MIDIKDISGNILLSTPINEGSKRKYTLMKEDYITLKFSLYNPILFNLGSYVDDSRFGLFEVVDLQKPTFDTSTGGYDYELRLDAYYWKWKNKKFKFTPETGGQEASWSSTATLDAQLGIFLRNLQALGYTYKGKNFEFSIDSTVENKSIAMTYDNMNMIDALSTMAEKWECEWWVTDSIIHFGRCEFGDPVDFKLGNNVETMDRSDSQTNYATRIYAFGSTRNIPTNYRPVDESMVVNGVVQKRLMLPSDTPYIDANEGMSQEEAVEDIVIFDDVYPRRIGTVSDITTHEYTETVKEEGKPDVVKKWNAYRFKDTGITFSKDYALEGQELKIIFQSGTLNGMEFSVTFNPCDKEGGETPIPEKLEDGSWNPAAQVWEIVRNEDYGRPIPDDTLKPKAGDTYVLSGFDSTSEVFGTMVSSAEQELKEKAEAYVAKSKVDPSTYSNKMMYDNTSELLGIGDRVNLINPAYFEAGNRQSRIIGFEYNLDLPWDHPIYTVGETAAYSRLGELENKVDNITYKGQTYTGGNGSGVYVIRTNDSTPASNSNVFSALNSLKKFLRKDQDDEAAGLIKFLKGIISLGDIVAKQGITVGESIIDSLIAGSGIIAKDGRIQADRMELRSSLTVMELIFNRLSAMESDYSFSESGTIDSVELLADGTYQLPLRKRWDNDFTSLSDNDVVYGVVNDLASGSGKYYTSWLRVLHVDTSANTINAVMYPDSEVPGGKNYPPEPLMILSHRGNPVNEERQGYWYLSSREKCICMLDGVTKPILEEHNYAVIVGKLKQLSIFDNLPISYRDSYIFCRGLVGQDILRVAVNGVPIVQHNDRGFWTATPDPAYSVSATSADTVWHVGCKWLCLINGTTDEPMYGSTGWAMLEGNPEFMIDIESSEGWTFDMDKIVRLYEDNQKPFTVLNVTGKLYNGDVTAHILDSDIEWKRDSGYITEDNAWAAAHAETGKRLAISLNDLGPHYSTMTGCKFIARALLRDGQQMRDNTYTVEF